METKVTTKKAADRRVSAKENEVGIEPFATLAETTPPKKRVAKKAASASKPAGTEAKPVKTVSRKTAKTIVSDPFAETVETTSPVKKRAVKAVNVAAKTVTAPKKAATKTNKKTKPDTTSVNSVAKPESELSPAFKVLAEPALPELPRENRARLQMQTPTRLYFYWSVKENPWALLRSVFGSDLGSYTLVHKLIDKKHGREEIRQTDVQGDFWFNVEPDGRYQAEIGFYAPNRPYFRILYSNTVETPRRSPSPSTAGDSDWTVSAAKFADVLDVAGFSRDAFDVAMAGDDHVAAENASHTAFAQFLGTSDYELHGVTAEDIRYAMLALASGAALEELGFKVSSALFAILQANAGNIDPGKAMNALTEYFDIDEAGFAEEQLGPAVFGASLVNFPRTLKTRTQSPEFAPRYSPVSSHSLR